MFIIKNLNIKLVQLLLFVFFPCYQSFGQSNQINGFDIPRLSAIAVNASDSLFINRISTVPVGKDGQLIYNLGGEWLFNPTPANDFEKQTTWDASWKKIEVPGEWVMQGVKVAKNHWAGYVRSFSIPVDWHNKLIKLRCDGVYSQCEIFINGEKVAVHLGGFTPFEMDITKLLEAWQDAVIAIKVKNESVADSLASGSSYAAHPLGGITRKIQLIALPEVNIGQLQVLTSFDKNYENATLTAQMSIRNESLADCEITLLFELFSPVNKEKIFSQEMPLKENISRGARLDKKFDFTISNPLKWDSEHPHLYLLRTTLIRNGKAEEVVEKNIGFRQIEVRGNRVFVNNMPIKLRGVCRHEVMPLRGRSLTGSQWEEDVKILRDGNVNYIRTSHYPPAEEFVDACDRLGMFLEVEAPFCWADGTPVSQEQYIPALQTQTLDMVDFFRSHPSVLIWSVGNESMKYKEYFSKTAALVKQLDPSRPRNFSQGGPDGDNNELEIGNLHYPGPGGPEKYINVKRPMVFDEYCHLNAYNRFELVTDPGIRDAWGIGMAAMWEKMYATSAILGGALWAGIDDTFILPDSTAVGYGTWGVIDGWRRTKPEYWHMKKAYSPVRILQKGNWKNNGVEFIIENRHLFTDMKECRIVWKLGKQAGTINPAIAPGQKAVVTLTCKHPLATETLKLMVYDARNILVDEYSFKNIVPQIISNRGNEKAANISLWKYEKKNDQIIGLTKNISIHINTITGKNLQIWQNKKEIWSGFAQLMVLPLNSEGNGIQMSEQKQPLSPFTATAQNRIIKKIETNTSTKVFTITIWDEYDEAKGYTMYHFNPDRTVQINYRYQMKQEINPRQWGLVFTLPVDFNTLSWKREGQWNDYPADHIGRLSGTAKAINSNPVSGTAGPFSQPDTAWLLDRNDLGSNDFRSTKMNIYEVALSDNVNTLKVTSNGEQHTRSWIDGDKIRLLIAGYSNMGAEGFFRSHAELMDKPLKKDDVIEDKIKIAFAQ